MNIVYYGNKGELKMTEITDSKRIFLKLEKVEPSEVKLEFDFSRNDEDYIYVMGYASTPDENSAGFIVENQALLDCWKRVKSEGKNVAVYEKHDYPVGKVVACEEMNGKVLVVMEIPRAGNERLIAVYEQGIYVGLSIGGWTLDGEWIEEKFHVTEFEWYEVSLTDIPANENALLLEYAKTKKPVIELENNADDNKEQSSDEQEQEQEQEQEVELEQVTFEERMLVSLENIRNKIRGI